MSSPPPDDPSPAARQLATCFAQCLRLAERCERAVEEGNWPFLAEAAGALSVAWDEVSAAASALTRESVATDPERIRVLVEQLRRPE